MTTASTSSPDSLLPPVGSRLRDSLASGRFAVTAELTPPRGTDLTRLKKGAALLHDYVDAANLTDNPSAVVRLASWAASAAVIAEDLEPICQLQCRDRNRIALQSDLLGLASIGIPNVLLLTGDHTRFGDHPEAKDVFDLDSTTLVWVASTLRDTGELMSGAKLQGSPRLLIGAVENPSAPPLEFRAQRLAKKVAAGAEFIQTQYIFDLDNFRHFVERAGELGALDHCKLLAGLGPIRSPRALERLSHSIPGVVVSDDVVARFKGVKDEDFAEVGLNLCAEMVAEIQDIPGVSGVHLMAFAWEESVPEILSRAGVAARQRSN